MNKYLDGHPTEATLRTLRKFAPRLFAMRASSLGRSVVDSSNHDIQINNNKRTRSGQSWGVINRVSNLLEKENKENERGDQEVEEEQRNENAKSRCVNLVC